MSAPLPPTPVLPVARIGHTRLVYAPDRLSLQPAENGLNAYLIALWAAGFLAGPKVVPAIATIWGLHATYNAFAYGAPWALCFFVFAWTMLFRQSDRITLDRERNELRGRGRKLVAPLSAITAVSVDKMGLNHAVFFANKSGSPITLVSRRLLLTSRADAELMAGEITNFLRLPQHSEPLSHE